MAQNFDNNFEDPRDMKSARWIPYLFLMAFVIVFAANGVMIATAMDSFPGFSDEYNQVHNLTTVEQTANPND